MPWRTLRIGPTSAAVAFGQLVRQSLGDGSTGPVLRGDLMHNDNRLVLTVTEVAAALGISRAHAYELVARGDLPSLRLGRRIVVPRRELDLLLGNADDGGPRGDVSAGDDQLVLTVTEVAVALGISRAHAYELVARGELPSLRLGRRIVVPRRELALLLAGDAGGSRAA